MSVDSTLSRGKKARAPTPAVLQVIPRLDAGGAERIALELAAAIAGRGGRALIASEGGRLVGELAARGGRWIELAAASKNPATILANVGRLAAIVRAESIDVLHAHSRAPAWSALLAARRTGIALATSFHGAYRQAGRAKALYNSVMARGDAVIANSRFTATLIGERFPFARSRIVTIPGAIDVTRFSPDNISAARIEALRAAWRIPSGARTVLLPARLSPVKGQRVLVAAAARLAAAGRTDLLFILAGDTGERSAYATTLAADIAAAGLGDRVRLVGHCTDIPAALRLADIAVMPSLVAETFGLAAVEAEAAACPVIVSDIGAFRETVLAPPDVPPAERTGWRVPVGDAEALAAALTEALDLSPDARAALLARARAHVLPRYSLEAMTAATLTLYHALAER